MSKPRECKEIPRDVNVQSQTWGTVDALTTVYSWTDPETGERCQMTVRGQAMPRHRFESVKDESGTHGFPRIPLGHTRQEYGRD